MMNDYFHLMQQRLLIMRLSTFLRKKLFLYQLIFRILEED